MDTFFIINDEMKIWRKTKGRLILQHYINKYMYKLFEKSFFQWLCKKKKKIISLFIYSPTLGRGKQGSKMDMMMMMMI